MNYNVKHLGKTYIIPKYEDKFNITSGTVDFKNLKSFWIEIESYILLKDLDIIIEDVIKGYRFSIKHFIREWAPKNKIKPIGIVDVNIKDKVFKRKDSILTKSNKTYCNFQINIYIDDDFVKDENIIPNMITDLSHNICLILLNNKNIRYQYDKIL